MLTNSGYQTLPGNRRTTGVSQQTATATDYAYQQPYNSSKSYHYHQQQQQQQKRRSDTSEPRGGRRFNSVTLPRRDVIVTCHETGTGNSRSTLATGSGGGGRSRLTPAVSDADIAGGSTHLSPRGGAPDDNRHRAAATRSNHVGGLISTSMLALPDTSI